MADKDKNQDKLQEDLFLPPVFAANPHLRVVGTGTTTKGHPYIKFINMDDDASMRQLVVIYATATRPGVLSYDYSIIDKDGIVTAYTGPYGDTDRDVATPWGVLS